ncbi:uncharacterized protein BO88DRAFT_24898 [Aspergillus vadensis CBS 113365]|uniref:Uncharacterized protein n=1 Tax=Aspergillus vadensis (strain CBS 113365 / IMI 142717 / IBT 24658) TaxID=1448311 RepID=A0A319BR02_ASPVC|nr:hypothetical protein BO88DRAFT_24898 [Aspergillus vadensis CBS 113365]PYH74884.1 hypothetical protein BO88DRAFT_24898 [Aspergillus vadensis CBS 113365]
MEHTCRVVCRTMKLHHHARRKSGEKKYIFSSLQHRCIFQKQQGEGKHHNRRVGFFCGSWRLHADIIYATNIFSLLVCVFFEQPDTQRTTGKLCLTGMSPSLTFPIRAPRQNDPMDSVLHAKGGESKKEKNVKKRVEEIYWHCKAMWQFLRAERRSPPHGLLPIHVPEN